MYFVPKPNEALITGFLLHSFPTYQMFQRIPGYEINSANSYSGNFIPITLKSEQHSALKGFIQRGDVFCILHTLVSSD